MYIVQSNSVCGNLLDLERLSNLTFFSMGSKTKVYKINGADIKSIKICSKSLAHPLVSKKVGSQYSKLIRLLTELIIDDDDSGESFREALNQIERFRMMIKNKYRNFLTQEEIETMSKQLLILQKEAKLRLLELQESYENMMSNNRSR